jgi:iron complex outermembrane receptor protein
VLEEGYPVGTFYGPKFEGVDENGEFILSEDSYHFGSAQPKLTLGFGMNFNYKKFDFAFSGYGLFGQKVLNAQGMVISSMNRLPSQNVPDAWLDKGIVSNPLFSDYWIENGDFFRLQTVTLGYTLPLKQTNWFSNVRFYTTAENLFVLTGYTGIDPEVNYNGLKSPGIDKSIGGSGDGDNYYYPRPRTITFGVNLSF